MHQVGFSFHDYIKTHGQQNIKFTYTDLIFLNHWIILLIYFAYFFTDKVDCLLFHLSLMFWDAQDSLVMMSAFQMFTALYSVIHFMSFCIFDTNWSYLWNETWQLSPSVFGVYIAKYMEACYLAVVKDVCWKLTFFTYILLTVRLGTIRVNNKLDALFNVFISLLYLFRATQCSSSGESIVSIHHLVYTERCYHKRQKVFM